MIKKPFKSSCCIVAATILVTSHGSADESDYQNTIIQTIHATPQSPVETVLKIENAPAVGNRPALAPMDINGATFELVSLHMPTNTTYAVDTTYIGPKTAEITITSEDPFTQMADEDGDGFADNWLRTRRDMPFTVKLNVQIPADSTDVAETIYMQWNGSLNSVGDHSFVANDKNFSYDSNTPTDLGAVPEDKGYEFSFPSTNLTSLGDAAYNSGGVNQSGFEVFSVWSSDGTKLDFQKIQVLPVASGAMTHSGGQTFTQNTVLSNSTTLEVNVQDTYPDSITWVKATALTGENTGTVYELNSSANTTNAPQDWDFTMNEFFSQLPGDETYRLDITTQASFDSDPQPVATARFTIKRSTKVRARITTQ